MSNKISFLLKNGLATVLLLVTFMIGSSFICEDGRGRNEKRLRNEIVKTAETYIGTKYKSGGKTPRGFDCSGFTSFVLKENNIKLGASSRAQALQGEPVKIKKLKPGDIVYFATSTRVNHVGIVAEAGRNRLEMIHASSSRGVIKEDVMKSSYWKKRLKGGRSVVQ